MLIHSLMLLSNPHNYTLYLHGLSRPEVVAKCVLLTTHFKSAHKCWSVQITKLAERGWPEDEEGIDTISSWWVYCHMLVTGLLSSSCCSCWPLPCLSYQSTVIGVSHFVVTGLVLLIKVEMCVQARVSEASHQGCTHQTL